ncbi:Ig-like domain repeat protein [Alloacidobacterium dinghuense]|uniref:Ig-like domain repeat protein n=1 Tax=Alloacidobacterium dinghuense TaxID=2763107 RepID=A0A7G8BHI7_9BACT|nr:Ig-like domain repeat protein [Alloacidobacterium dinghuense]
MPNLSVTATRLSSSPEPSLINQPVTLVAVVVAPPDNSGTPTGTVTFFDGLTPIGVAILEDGVAT